MSEENQDKGASSGDEGSGAATTSATDTTPKLNTTDGVMKVDGKKVVYESDLIAAKKSLETAGEQAQTVHNDAIDKAKVDLSDTQQQLAAANAKLQEYDKARTTGAEAQDTEATARAKQDTDAANSRVETAEAKSLELRRANLVLQYQISAEQLAEKNMEQLDSFEEALKAIAASQGGGAGKYALGSGSGDAVPQTPLERASAVIANTPVRGVRTAESQQ